MEPEQPELQQYVDLEIPQKTHGNKIIYSVWFVFGINLISGTRALHFIKNLLLFLDVDFLQTLYRSSYQEGVVWD